MTERDQKTKITHKPADTDRSASQCRIDISARALSVRKNSATPWIMLTRVSSMLTTTESSSRRPSLDGFTMRLVTAQRLNCQGRQECDRGRLDLERRSLRPFSFLPVQALAFLLGEL